ncbi:uncharacterized protein LOC118188968 isoform X1 [Stegodyphus dumicola]|uniref:uncharacterized protein LOC118188968 isoform X1 n=1 Tax=Stegodyphus dumicola TaxID=202533 RepID=UPI0015AF0A12|nr:uncharacterized protein LOC118188968 isoform X1 [Stegodyphus dumicola]
MSSTNAYTLPELVDLALRTPEVGAVNFNILRIVLLSLISDTGLSQRKVYWEVLSASAITKSLFGEKDKIERKAGAKGTDSPTSDDTQEEEDEPEVTTKGAQVGLGLAQLFEAKKLSSKLEAIEEELGALVDAVDELRVKITETTKKVKYEEGQKRIRREEAGDLDRDEFEDALEEIGEAIGRLAIKFQEQADKSQAASEKFLEELSSRVIEEKMDKLEKPINQRLENMALMIAQLQRFIADAVCPDAAGVTKCMTCGRRANLAYSDYISGTCRAHHRKKKSPKPRSPFKKEGKKPHQLVFTDLSLNKLKKETEEATQVILLQDDNRHADDPTAKDVLEGRRWMTESQYDADNSVAFFAPLRVIPPDMRRRNVIMADIRSPGQTISLSVASGTPRWKPSRSHRRDDGLGRQS